MEKRSPLGKILIADDDEHIRGALTELLRKENYLTQEAGDGNAALELLDDTFDLVILDVMMPGKDGIRTCTEIRKKYTVPILFLTAKDTEYDKYSGLLAGGDDYLAKPFSRLEFLARIKSLLRRYHVYQGKGAEKQKETEAYIYIKDLKIDKGAARVFREQKEIVLTSTEYRMLMLFAANPNKIFTLEHIYEHVWNEPYHSSANAAIMVHIRNLRKKLDDTPHGTKYVKNIWGRGYCIEEQR